MGMYLLVKNNYTKKVVFKYTAKSIICIEYNQYVYVRIVFVNSRGLNGRGQF